MLFSLDLGVLYVIVSYPQWYNVHRGAVVMASRTTTACMQWFLLFSTVRLDGYAGPGPGLGPGPELGLGRRDNGGQLLIPAVGPGIHCPPFHRHAFRNHQSGVILDFYFFLSLARLQRSTSRLSRS